MGSPNKLLNIGSLADNAPNPNPNPTPSPAPSPTPTPGFSKVGDGFCRTAAGASGTFEETAVANFDQCAAACSAQPTCVAVEFQATPRCELHTQGITRVASGQGSVCFVKVAATPETTPTVTAPPEPTTSPPQIRFVAEVSAGTCSDVGGLAINDQDLCELAAAVLGVPDRTASQTSAVERPEGCYVFRGNRLFMGVNPASLGKGAETSTPGRSRHPICGFTA